jgi:hypothetical protein
LGNKMKILAYIFLIALSVSCIASGAEAPPGKTTSSDPLEGAAVAALIKNKEILIQQERYLAERIYGKEKSKLYLEYFTRGLDSKTGAIMIEGEENQWLEIAFARGYSTAFIFMWGYRQGKAE